VGPSIPRKATTRDDHGSGRVISNGSMNWCMATSDFTIWAAEASHNRSTFGSAL
jgi:hypothetical protein